MGSTVMESNKDGSKKIPKKRRSLRIDMPGELPVCTSCPTRGIFQRSSSVSPPSCPGSAPVLTKVSPGSPKNIFPYPSQQQGSSSPKSPRRLSFSGMFRSSSGSSSSSIKLFSRARKDVPTRPCFPGDRRADADPARWPQTPPPSRGTWDKQS